jgi:hypothetical protein
MTGAVDFYPGPVVDAIRRTRNEALKRAEEAETIVSSLIAERDMFLKDLAAKNARIQELLECNTRELNRRQLAEHRLYVAKMTISLQAKEILARGMSLQAAQERARNAESDREYSDAAHTR